MKRKQQILLLVLLGLICGAGIFALSSFSGKKAPAVEQSAVSTDAGYRVGERLQPAQTTSSEKPAVPSSFEEVPWHALVPKDWDPMKMFGDDMSNFNDADPRAIDALRKLREEWDNAPTEPSMNGAHIRIAGFAVPLESENGKVKEFLLVPYFGACIHTPPPPANQIIHVFSDKPLEDVQAMDALWVSGVLEVAKSRSSDNTMGIAGSIGYRMQAKIVTSYKNTPQPPSGR